MTCKIQVHRCSIHQHLTVFVPLYRSSSFAYPHVSCWMSGLFFLFAVIKNEADSVQAQDFFFLVGLVCFLLLLYVYDFGF